ncbi:hypothetical protein F6Q08_04730 [Pectobacterium parmentieri]|nr:hypothetical protein [Pectobacterium parmentieri]
MTDKVIDLAMNNAGIRDTAWALHTRLCPLII